MKSSKLLLTAVTVVFMFAAPGCKKQDAVDFSLQAGPPVLRIDGKENPGVYLQSLDIQIEVTGNVASTRYTMVFKNKTNRMLEGELTFPLPDGRTVTHYALDIDGRMREAVPVEKARATEVFEEIQQREVDPGILERVEGNNFRTRIYPFPRNGTRTISIGYEEELALENGLLHYRLPMVYPNPLKKFTVKVIAWKGGPKPLIPDFENEFRFDIAGENHVASFVRKNYRPARALTFSLPAPTAIPQIMMQPAQGSHYFLTSVVPGVEPRRKHWDDNLAIIWDVSLSATQRNLQREMEMLNIIFAEKKNVSVHLYFLNNEFKKIANANAAGGEYRVVNGNWNELKNALNAAAFDGGTDFSKIDLSNMTGNEILFFSDGLSTLSDARFLKDTTINRPIHGIVSSAQADYNAMRLIADATNGKFINVNALSPAQLKNELLNETLLFLGMEHGYGVREVYPSIAAPVHGVFSAAGISDIGDAELALLFGFGDEIEERLTVRLDAKNAANRGNIYKIWAQKKIAELDLDYENNHAELMELGQQFGIVTRNTSLIVLETVSDYAHFGIEPPASEPELLAAYRLRIQNFDRKRKGGFATDIDAVLSGVNGLRGAGGSNGGTVRAGVSGIGFSGGFGVGLGSSGNTDRAEASGMGFGSGLGVGLGGSGHADRAGAFGVDFDSGLGTGYVKRGNDDPGLRETAGSVDGIVLTGGRTTRSIRRVVMQNWGVLHHAYNRRLRERPDLDGVITVRFSINSFGTVTGEEVINSTISDPELEKTVLETVQRFVFESIDRPGDVTMVTYPFTFSSAFEVAVVEMPPRETRTTGNSMLYNAVLAARDIRQWRNTDFSTPPSLQIYRFPVPDARESVSDGDFARADAAGNNDNMSRLTGKLADDYRTYLKLRDDHINSPVFYFDMAHRFYTHNNREIALRILTSIAELGTEDASLYRLLGYRLREYGEYALAKFIFQKVLQWRPMEPQSYRDYALALADNGEAQAALDFLYELFTRSFSASIRRRSLGMEEVVVTEINHLIAKNPHLDISKIDKRLLIDIPVDIRVVLNWNMNNINIDLHVADPHNRKFTHGRQPYPNGRMSDNNKSGYGPEQFLLKNAARGSYRVYARYVNEREFAAAGPLVVMAEIYTKYADKTEQRQIVSRHISNVERRSNREGSDGKIPVTEFEF